MMDKHEMDQKPTENVIDNSTIKVGDKILIKKDGWFGSNIYEEYVTRINTASLYTRAKDSKFETRFDLKKTHRMTSQTFDGLSTLYKDEDDLNQEKAYENYKLYQKTMEKLLSSRLLLEDIHVDQNTDLLSLHNIVDKLIQEVSRIHKS